MFRKKHGMMVAATALLLCIAACQRTPGEKSPKAPTQRPVAGDSAAKPPVPPSQPLTAPSESASTAEEPLSKPIMPRVTLTDTLAATCLVKVGDRMPEGRLADSNGRVVELRSTFGPRLTVVCFWKAGGVYSMEELQQLEKHVAAPYAARGVRVVGVNEKDAPRVVAENAREIGATFPCLLDPDGSFFAKVATEGLPRTYLVDQEGRILWFDIEYSRGTLRDLVQAIDYVLTR
ncbi:MAG TPA: redoxin family protein [Thermoguttaceae bacterium]|nr:redoxin family protein [Thermoguttaceae bacterium]